MEFHLNLSSGFQGINLIDVLHHTEPCKLEADQNQTILH